MHPDSLTTCFCSTHTCLRLPCSLLCTGDTHQIWAIKLSNFALDPVIVFLQENVVSDPNVHWRWPGQVSTHVGMKNILMLVDRLPPHPMVTGIFSVLAKHQIYNRTLNSPLAQMSSVVRVWYIILWCVSVEPPPPFPIEFWKTSSLLVVCWWQWASFAVICNENLDPRETVWMFCWTLFDQVKHWPTKAQMWNLGLRLVGNYKTTQSEA